MAMNELIAAQFLLNLTNESSENTFAPLSKCKWHVLPIFIKNLEERSVTEAMIVSSVSLSLSNSWVNMLCYTKNKKSLDWHWLGWGNELCRTTVTRLFLSGTGTHVNILSGRQNEPTHQTRESRHPGIASQLTNPHTCLFTIDILSNKTPIFQVDILDGDRICDLIASALLYQFYSSSDRSDMWYSTGSENINSNKCIIYTLEYILEWCPEFAQ